MYPHGCEVCNHLSLFLCVADYDKLLPGKQRRSQRLQSSMACKGGAGGRRASRSESVGGKGSPSLGGVLPARTRMTTLSAAPMFVWLSPCLSLAGWSHFAQFTIAVVNKDPKKSKYSGQHQLLLLQDDLEAASCMQPAMHG